MLFCWERKKQHLTILVYVSYFLCVYCAQCDVLCDFCMKWFCCSMKAKTIVPSIFGVCVNFKIRPFQWSAVQLCGEMALGKGGGWKTAAIIYCWQQQHVRCRTAQLSDISSGATCIADLDSAALALTKEASGNSRGWHVRLVPTTSCLNVQNHSCGNNDALGTDPPPTPFTYHHL